VIKKASIIFILVAVLLFLIGTMWAVERLQLSDFIVVESGNTPQEMFAALIAAPGTLPAANIQGGGDTWQGYALYLRFEAPAADMADYLQQEQYEPADCAAVLSELDLPPRFESKFSPIWTPNKALPAKCYVKYSVKNGWTHLGTHSLLIGRDNVVHFYGVGG
jgi:hypothetical protein